MIGQILITAYSLLVMVLVGYMSWFAVSALRSCRHRCSAHALRRQERVSVIVPAANEQALLASCLDSILKQDLSSVDSIVVALNGCTDGSEQIVDRYARRHPLIAKIVLEKSSKVEAILAAMRSVPSRHVVVIDADMGLEKNALPRLLQFHFDARSSVSTCLIDPLTSETAIAKLISCDRLFRSRILNLARNAWGLANLPGNLFVVDKVLYRSLMQRDTLLEDNEFTYQLWRHGKGVLYLPEVLAYERERLSLAGLVYQRKRWVLGNIDTFSGHLRALAMLTIEKRLVALSYMLLWYVVHYALAAGSAMALIAPGWRAVYLVLAGVYGACVALSLLIRPTRRIRGFSFLDAATHVLVFPWAVSLATALAILQWHKEAQAFCLQTNRSSFIRDGLVGVAEA